MTERDYNKTLRWTLYTTGVIQVLLGAMTLILSLHAGVVRAMGVGFLIAGCNNLVPALSMRGGERKPPRWLLPVAVIDVIWGAIFILLGGPRLFALPALMASYLLISGAARIWGFFSTLAAGEGGPAGKRWPLSGISAIIMAIAIFAVKSFATLLVSLALIVQGVISLAEARICYPVLRKGN